MTATIGTVIGKTTGSTFQIDVNPDPIAVELVTVNRIDAKTAGMSENMIVFFSDPIGGLSASTPYYVQSINPEYFSVSDSSGGSILTLTDSSVETNFLAIDLSTLSNPTAVVRNDNLNQYFQIDYGDLLERIATSLENLSVQTTTIATQITTIAEKTTAIETYQKKMKELGEGDGIHMVGPYEWLSMYAIYKLLVQQNDNNWASIKAQIDALPKNF